MKNWTIRLPPLHIWGMKPCDWHIQQDDDAHVIDPFPY